MTVEKLSFWKRRRTWIIIAILLSPIFILFLASRSFFLSHIVASVLQNKIGIEVEVGSATLSLDGQLSLEDVVFKAEGISGPASNVVTFSTLLIHYNEIIPFSIESADIGTATFRIAENSVDSSDFNFSHLFGRITSVVESSDSVSEPSTELIDYSELIPFEIQRLVIETGMMSGKEWSLENQREFLILNKSESNGKLIFELGDLKSDQKSEVVISTEGNKLEVKLNGVSIEESFVNMLPRTARIWCEETKLLGDVKNIKVDWGGSAKASIEALVDHVSFLLPQEHGMEWARYNNGLVEKTTGKTKLNLNSGIVKYDGDSLKLEDIKGDLFPPNRSKDSVGFSANIDIYDFPTSGNQESGKWMSSMLSTAPFKAEFDIDDFKTTENGDVNLPAAAAQILKIFQLKQWKIDADIIVERETIDGDIVVRGELEVNAESGKYELFPYQLDTILAEITFEQNTITIQKLIADGSGDSRVHIAGQVYAKGDVLDVSLNLDSEKIPLDDRLRNALPENFASIMDSMIDHQTYDRVVGSLDSAESEGYKFDLGGDIVLKLSIKHDNRINEEVNLSGEIAFKDIGILHKVFPYPVELKNGYVTLDAEGLHALNNAIKFSGYGGGEGLLAGEIFFTTKEGWAAPAIAVMFQSDHISPAFIAAVSEVAGSSNELAAGVLTGLGLSSKLDIEGTVGFKNGEIDSSFTANLKEGTAKLNENFAKAINATGPFWPNGFEFTDVFAEIEINNGDVTMEGTSCECGDGSVNINKMSIANGVFELDFVGTNLPLSPQFVNVLPSAAPDKLDSSWKLLEPGGYVDGSIKMAYRDGESSLKMAIEPKLISVSGNDETVNLLLSRGSIEVQDTSVILNDLEFKLESEEELQGTLNIKGAVNGDKKDFGFTIDADWADAQIGSPLTRAITGMIGGEMGIDYYDDLDPSGNASAILESSTNDDGTVRYDIIIKPTELHLTRNEREATVEFKSNNNNVIRFTNEGLTFENIVGKLGDGFFTIDTSSDNIGTIDLTWQGDSADENLFAVLPKVVGDTLEAIKLEGGTSELDNGQFILKGDNWESLDFAFNADISLNDVSIDVGVPLKGIHGKIIVAADYEEERLSALSLEFLIEKMSLLGRPVNEVFGKLVLDETSNKLEFENMGGKSTTGGVAVDGWISVGEAKDYEIEVFVSDVKIGAEESDDVLASLEGELVGWLSIAGTRDDVTKRRGVGMLRVRNGKLSVDPLSMTAMQLLQLALPTSRSISGADIDMYIEGENVVLDHIVLKDNQSSTDLELTGEGTVDLENFTIYARLHPRVGWPIIRDIAGTINDQLYSIDITGELFNPSVSVVPLPFLNRN